MKTIAKRLLIFVSPFWAISAAHGKSWWQPMDIASVDTPSRYGYHVSRTAAQDKDHYVITIDPAAAAALTGASIIRNSEPGDARKMEIIEVNGRKKIEFTVPPDFLQPSAVLRLDSGPIKYCGPESTFDFNGYSLRLDNIPRDSATLPTLAPTVRKLNGDFEFTYNLYEPPSISSLSPELKRRVLSITLESTVQGRLSVPMPCTSETLDQPVKFVLPGDSLSGFMLVVEMTHQGDFSGSKASKHYVALGIIAANAEAAAAAQPDATRPPR